MSSSIPGTVVSGISNLSETVRKSLSDPTVFVRENTRLHEVPLTPEIRLYLADELIPIWQITEKELDQSGLPPPYWAFAWAGGQALARYILDNPDIVRGKRVLDFAAGSGVVAVAAAMAGASRVIAADIDKLAVCACLLNGEANGVPIDATAEDLVGTSTEEWDVILTGDICYEQPLAGEVEAWLRGAAGAGCLVLIGDPGRTYLPKERIEKLVTYSVKTTRELEDTDVRNTSVWRMME